MADEQNEELESEMAFLTAMNAYRKARNSGDPQEIAKAEEAWRSMVRDELRQKETGCK